MDNTLGFTVLAPDIWVDFEPVRVVGTKLSATMTVLRLADGCLLVHSPVALTSERRIAVERLGHVKHLYAPNLYHHLWLAEWAAAFPEARVHAPAALRKKRPDLRVDRVHGDAPDAAFAELIDEVQVHGCRLEEAVLFFRPAQILIVADLVHNVGRPTDRWTEIFTRASGFYDRVALSRVLRWTQFSHRAAARASLDQLLQLPFEGLVVGHGTPLSHGGRQALEEAYRWLARP